MLINCHFHRSRRGPKQKNIKQFHSLFPKSTGWPSLPPTLGNCGAYSVWWFSQNWPKAPTSGINRCCADLLCYSSWKWFAVLLTWVRVSDAGHGPDHQQTGRKALHSVCSLMRGRNVPDHCSRVTFRKFTLFCIVTLYLSLGFPPLTSLLRSIFHFSKQRNCFSFFFCEFFSFKKTKFSPRCFPSNFGSSWRILLRVAVVVVFRHLPNRELVEVLHSHVSRSLYWNRVRWWLSSIYAGKRGGESDESVADTLTAGRCDGADEQRDTNKAGWALWSGVLWKIFKIDILMFWF